MLSPLSPTFSASLPHYQKKAEMPPSPQNLWCRVTTDPPGSILERVRKASLSDGKDLHKLWSRFKSREIFCISIVWKEKINTHILFAGVFLKKLDEEVIGLDVSQTNRQQEDACSWGCCSCGLSHLERLVIVEVCWCVYNIEMKSWARTMQWVFGHWAWY